MFERILIANRGEIACRIIKSAKAMGIETIAVFSEADRAGMHVHMADQAYCIGPAPAQESYLNIERIIEVALQSKAQAIHPGYGFLSENPHFAKACKKANLCFIGPSLEALEAMASKQTAKQLLEQTTVPLTPGYHGNNQEAAILLEEAEKIGFPVLLKAASGGGGKGMRIVHDKNDFTDALKAAQRESLSSFADDTIIIEKFVEKARHVEIQIIADTQGNILHLFERDCSLQRRHQKIIEEAPAPNLSSKLRQSLAQSAIEVAAAISYIGAGTVEFLVDGEAYYFMEMNTRLQVEHPVTEMITGIDLVALQISVAAGEALPLRQEDITQSGHAIECRLYAEDPDKQFMPSIGQIDYFKLPEDQDIRIDCGVQKGSKISQYYDPMIAKLITKGRNRKEALLKMQQALKQCYIHGVKTNLPFLSAICTHPAFIAAEIDTNFLQTHSISMPKLDKRSAVLIAAGWRYWQGTQQPNPLLSDCLGWQAHLKPKWLWTFVIDNQSLELNLKAIDKNHFQLDFEGQSYHCVLSFSDDTILIDDARKIYKGSILEQGDTLHVFSEGQQLSIEPVHWQHSDEGSSPQSNLRSPMPASVVAVLKNKGDTVTTGERLMVLEAMKMEHTVHAPYDGRITDLFYSVGAQVEEGAELLKLEEMAHSDKEDCL